jgi:uncharacterized protein with gpF-like domain
MAEPVQKIVLNTIMDHCPNVTCPYRAGEETNRKQLEEKIAKKLKHRVADGNEVRALEKRVDKLEKVLRSLLKSGAKLSKTDVENINNALKEKNGNG